MQEIAYDAVVRPDLARGAVVRCDFPGFFEDYQVLHCLIRAHRPQRFFEIGTSSGNGTKVICKAMSTRRLWPDTRDRVFSLDVPPGTDPAIIYPGAEDGHPAKAGAANRYPYRQLFGDSTRFDISPYLPLDGWFIDGKHDYAHAESDTKLALSAEPRLVVWHDLQIEGVVRAVEDVMAEHPEYGLWRVTGTRVGYALRADACATSRHTDTTPTPNVARTGPRGAVAPARHRTRPVRGVRRRHGTGAISATPIAWSN